MILTACIFLKHLIKLKKQIKKNFDTQFLQASNLLNTKFHLDQMEFSIKQIRSLEKLCVKIFFYLLFQFD
jgi:hypothetical protein